MNGSLLLSGPSSFLRLQNATSFAQADLTGTNSTLTVEGTAATPSSTLSGATVNLDAAGVRFGASGNITLTLASTTTVRGMGLISSDLQFSGLGTIINQGLIAADLAGQTLTISPDAFTNQGTAQATNGGTLTIAATNWNNNTGTLGVNASTLNLGGTFTNPGAISRTGGTINITGLWDNTGLSYTLNSTTGDFVLNGGTLRGGTLNQSGGSLRANGSGNNILDGATVNGSLLLSGPSSFLRLQNAASFAQADLTGTNSTLTVEGTAATPSSTLSGATVNLDAAGVRFGASGNITLTLANSTTVRGMGLVSSDLQFSGLGTIINQGAIRADVSGQTLTINPDVFTNQGSFAALNGATLTISATSWSSPSGTLTLDGTSTVNFAGTFTNPGAIMRTGGTINVTGLWDNTGLAYTLDTSTGDFVLNGGTIRGGTINQSGGSLRFSTSGNNILDGVTVTGPGNGPLLLSNASSFLRLTNATTFTEADLTGTNSTLTVEGTAATPSSTLSGATVNLDAAGVRFGASGNITLTLASTTTVRGMGLISSDLQFSGLGTIINQGMISADLAGQTLTINPDVFTNQGTVQAINGAILTISSANWSNPTGLFQLNDGTINFGGTFTDLGAVNVEIGTINITGTWNNTGNSYTLNGLTGDFRLNGGTIIGGTINQPGARGLRFSNNGNNILNGVAVGGPLVLSDPSAFVRLLNATTFTQADLTGSNATLIVEGTTATPSSTLSGATVNMDVAGGRFGVSGNMTLTLASTTTVRGRGTISSDLQFSGLGIINNQGTIAADTAGQTLTINPDTFNNSGTVRASNGGTVSFGTVYTQLTGGELDIVGSTATSTSALQIQGGLVHGFGNINAAISNNAMLRPDLGAATGLRVTGNVTLLSSSNLVFQLGGLSQGTQYGFLNVIGSASLGGNLVVSFVNSFQAANANSFTVLTSTAPITGMFANVASGGRLQASDLSGSFLVNYSGNSIVLSDFTAGVLQGDINPVGGTSTPAAPTPNVPADLHFAAQPIAPVPAVAAATSRAVPRGEAAADQPRSPRGSVAGRRLAGERTRGDFRDSSE